MHYKEMVIIMILSGLLSTMNIWADKIEDMNFSLNDVYMISLMTGWMLFFMGIKDSQTNIISIGAIVVCISIICIRKQFIITEKQYLRGMVPHHSMAVHMSRKLLEKQNNIPKFLNNIINTQETEITDMKKRLKNSIQR